MKKLFLGLAFILGVSTSVFSQETNIYSFFVNIVSEGFRFPLVGFVNIAQGNNSLPQIGFINVNTNNFTSLQTGFVNTTKGDFSGAQVGFVNTIGGGFYGTQIGFINTAVREGQGLQLGFVNATIQKLNGVQIGFINYTDSIENGIPIGFISIVRNGGYKAIEYSFSEFYPVNLGLKIGVERFYTTIIAAYNPFEEITSEQFAVGFGVGSIIPINGSIFINPELNSLSSFWANNQQLTSFILYFGYNINKVFKITAGPSVTWVNSGNNNGLQKPFFNLYEYVINEKNSIVAGARVGVRLQF